MIEAPGADAAYALSIHPTKPREEEGFLFPAALVAPVANAAVVVTPVESLPLVLLRHASDTAATNSLAAMSPAATAADIATAAADNCIISLGMTCSGSGAPTYPFSCLVAPPTSALIKRRSNSNSNSNRSSGFCLL